MEIHQRLYDKLDDVTTAITTAAGLVPILCNSTGGAPSEPSNPGASTSLVSACAFLPFSAVGTNELTRYSGSQNNCLSPLMGHGIEPTSLSLGLTNISAVAATTQNLNDSHHQHHHQHQHQQHHHHHHHQQQQQQQRTLSSSSQNLTNCPVESSERLATIITSSSSSSSSSSSTSNSLGTGGCPVTTTNEPNFSQRNPKFEAEICSSCSEYILDRTLLNVNSRFWHISCLRCSQCSMLLEQYPSCFVKDGTFFCKQCYNRQFGTKCSSCRRLIQATDWVRRARSFVYHLACFACDQCKRQLSTGEEFALLDCRLLCKQHYLELVEGESGQQKTKAKRVRTTFAEEQLAVLQTHFQIDSNPDGADLERIASMTGLSKRVTQVWFQNSRARQKKYQGSRKNRMSTNNSNSGRSSTDPCSSPKSPSGDSTDGMIFPTSVLTSAEDAMITPEQQQTVLPTPVSNHR